MVNDRPENSVDTITNSSSLRTSELDGVHCVEATNNSESLLVKLAEGATGKTPLRILVTGGTGFVGASLARVLVKAGHQVTICGRNRYRFPIKRSQLEFVEADFTDREKMLQLCQNRDLVYHVGAKSSPWGTREEFHRSNVEGTQNIVDGCLLHKVPRLVYVSSTAIFFEFTDKQGIRDDAPFPQQFCCEYARSKAHAEVVVNKAVSAGLNAITIRARAVFGPGDNALLPRLIAAARQGRLRQIGDGTNTIDMTHIDNLVAALLLAARRGEAGTICTITNDEPIQLWPLLKQVLSELGICAQLRTVPRSLALMAASVLEWQHRFFNRSGEPLMTRYAAGLLSRTQTFDLASARTALGYEPIVGMQHAVRSTLATMKSKEETPSNASVTLRMFSTGFTSHPAHLAEYGAPKDRVIRFHAMVGVIDHPTEGLTLFDTGYSPAFFNSTERLPYKLYRWTTPVETCEALSIGSVLRRNGIEPKSIRRIILSHFHADHVCGLKDFPDVEILASARAWHAINGKRGFAAVKLAILPGLFPADIERRLRLIDHFHGPGFGPFESTHDIFGDGSVRMVDLTGHAIGQIGLLLQRSHSGTCRTVSSTDCISTGNTVTEKTAYDSNANVTSNATSTAHLTRCLLAADAAWTSRTIKQNLPATIGFRLLAASAREAQQTQKKLHELHVNFPDVEIIPTHCPDVAMRYGFDQAVDQQLAAARASDSSGVPR